MGCAGSVNPDKFLVTQSKDSVSNLFPDLPASDDRIVLTFKIWYVCDFYNGKHCNNDMTDEGINGSEELQVNGPSGLVGTIVMAPNRSYKVLTIVKNAAGEVIAGLFTAETSRPDMDKSSSYYILGSAPRMQGQEEHMKTPEGKPLYHWATVTRGPNSFSRGATVTTVNGNQNFATMKSDEFRDRWQIKNTQDQGIALVENSKTQKGMRECMVAPGVDPGLMVLITLAQQRCRDQVLLSSNFINAS